MTEWIIYQSPNAPEAAERLRHVGRRAVCVMQFDRRAPCRWVKPKAHEDAPKRTAWGNHLFVQGRVDQPTRDRARVKIWEVRCAGRPGFLLPRDVALMFDPDALWAHPKGKFWLDENEDEARERWKAYIRRHRKDQLAQHQFRPGQRVRYQLAAQRLEGDILEVRGNELEVGLSLLGMERISIHYADVEVAA